MSSIRLGLLAKGQETTSDATTVTEVVTWAPPNSSSGVLKISLNVSSAAGCRAFKWMVSYSRDTTGIVLNVLKYRSMGDATLSSAQALVFSDGTNIVVGVLGVAATTIYWVGTIESKVHAEGYVSCAGRYSQKSIVLDGANEYAVSGNILGYDYSNDFSLSCWMKTSSSSTGILMGKMAGGPAYAGYSVASASGRIYLLLYSNAAVGNYIIARSTNTSYADGNWHNVSLVWAGSNPPFGANATLYVDGVLSPLEVTLDALTTSIVNGVNFAIGGRYAVNDLYFNGYVDSVSVYSRKLNALEARWIYNGKRPRDLNGPDAISSLASYWKVGDGDVFPTLTATVGPANATMTNMEAGDIQGDVP